MKARRHNTRKVKFWEWINGGWVRIKLPENGTLTHDVGGPTDEGYHRESTTWAERSGRVLRTIDSEGRDCDGKHESHTEYECPASMLSHMESTRMTEDELPVFIPKWGRIAKRCHVRDHTAEAAGY